jgi:membrane protein implicated in regulation of membrane protease activity
MIADWIGGIGAWAWIILGLVLIGLELLAPAIFFVWLGLAAIVTGVVDGLVGLSWQASTLLFAVLSVASVLLGRVVSRPLVRNEDPVTLNRRGEALIGRVFTLETPLAGGEGRIRVDDSSWRVTGADRPAGTAVRIVRVEGATLVVEAADGSPAPRS